MADEHHKWLDRDAAERLLRGEPLEGIDSSARADAHTDAHGQAPTDAQAQAERLARALSALDRAGEQGTVSPSSAAAAGTASDSGADGELPGEAAALAAFRAARAERADAPAAVRGGSSRTAPYATPAHEAAAGETVRLGRTGNRPRPSRWGRPVRLGVAAALAGCMLGGVAVAAGTGVLPSPFGKHSSPGPAASASTEATPEESLPSPSGGTREPSEDLSPDETTAPDDTPTSSREPVSSPPPEAEADDEHTGVPQQPSGDRTPPPRRDEARKWYRKVVVACRAYRSGELQGKKRRRLEEAAKGPERVEEFCGRVLGGGGAGGGRPGNGHGGGQGGGDGGHDGEDGDGESGGEEDGGSGGDTGGAPVPPVTSPSAPHPGPATSRSALPYFS
ncbi:hypothetical protein [Streptomyces venezuelae]|uniref:hypothetical protein n=1 Tax=Streptomyces venezuelae TaxID=54571 RepID=UPI00365D9F22